VRPHPFRVRSDAGGIAGDLGDYLRVNGLAASGDPAHLPQACARLYCDAWIRRRPLWEA